MSSRCLPASGGLLSKSIITQDLVNVLLSWPPARRAYASESDILGSMFSAGQGYIPEISKQCKIWPVELVRLWRIIRTSLPACASQWQAGFSQERMSYVPEESKVIYQSKDGKQQRVFAALEWPALLNNRSTTLPSFHFPAIPQTISSALVLLFNRVNGNVFSCA
jgi:hypothetical protein